MTFASSVRNVTKTLRTSGNALSLILLNKIMKVDFLVLLPVFPEEDRVGISFSFLVPKVGRGEYEGYCNGRNF